MKNLSYANRGDTLEMLLRYANERYRRQGEAFIRKQPTEFIPIRDRTGRIVSCKVEEKATMDFMGRYKQYPIAIEAKNSNTDHIRWDAVQENQAQDMDAFCSYPGTIGLVVVAFNRLAKIFAIPWALWSLAYNIRVKENDKQTPLTITAYGQTWEIPQKFSIRIDEIPPTFEVDTTNTTYNIHYLEKAENYIS